MPEHKTHGVWWADRLAPTLIAGPDFPSDAVLLGASDAPWRLTADEAEQIGAVLIAAAAEVRSTPTKAQERT